MSLSRTLLGAFEPSTEHVSRVERVPLTGVPLPLVSYGGSSLLANLVILGCLVAISNVAGTDEPFDAQEDGPP